MTHPLVECILQAGRGLKDHGLFFASLTARLIYSLDNGSEREEVSPALLTEKLEKAALPLDLSSLSPLLSLARTHLSAQASACGMTKGEVDTLAIKLLEAWLVSLPEGGGAMGEVIVRVKEGGAGDVDVVPGLLFKYEPTFKAPLRRKEQVRVALYNVMLDHHQGGEEWDGLHLEYRRGHEGPSLDLVSQLQGLGVGLLLCQKVVNEDVKAKLEHQLGIHVVERLGTAAFSRVARVVGGRVVSSSSHKLEYKDLGRVEVVEEVEVQGANFLRLCGAGLVSIVVGSMGEEQGEELELVMEKALSSLSSLATQENPKVLPGGGCTESVLATQTEGALCKALTSLALLPSGLSKDEAWVDADHGHLWRDDGEACVCGLLQGRQSRTLLPCLEVMQRSSIEVEPVKGLLCEARARLVLDSLDTKRAALELALETSETLADIGVIVKC